jgi:hypothetical protein
VVAQTGPGTPPYHDLIFCNKRARRPICGAGATQSAARHGTTGAWATRATRSRSRSTTCSPFEEAISDLARRGTSTCAWLAEGLPATFWIVSPDKPSVFGAAATVDGSFDPTVLGVEAHSRGSVVQRWKAGGAQIPTDEKCSL